MLSVRHLLPSLAESAAGLSSAVSGLQLSQRLLGIDAVSIGSSQIHPLRRDCSLERFCYDADIVHSHGLWLAPSRVTRRLRRTGVPTVIAPHGMLDPWALQRRRAIKQLLWWLGEGRTLNTAGCLHALCSAEISAIRDLGIRTPIALIPNGVFLPDRRQSLPLPPWQAQIPEGTPVLLFLGRFHPKKGVFQLLEAWKRFALQATSYPAPWLVLVGYGDQAALSTRVRKEELPRCLVMGPAHGPLKLSCFANSSGFVLPSFSEGLPMAALEAMSWSLPCLLSSACNLPQAFSAGAALQAEPDVDQLVQSLHAWSTLTSAGAFALGAAGEQLVRDQFSWSRVAAQTSQLYSWLLHSGPRPNFLID